MIDLTSIQDVHKDLEKRTWDLLKQEALMDSKELKDPKDEFYQNPCGFGLYKKLAFYNCYQCKKPYYGGMVQCLDGLEQINAKDFICSACSGIGQQSCAQHGKEFIIYKCKFCCAVSSFKCWGTTHFCKSCHDRQEAHDYMTTKTPEQLMQCPGPELCKLGMKHPPNGTEFSLGCALCRGTDVAMPQISNLDLPQPLPQP